MEHPKPFILDFPKEACVPIGKGQTILDAALQAGISLFHVCGGKAKCSTCRVLIIEGDQHLANRTEAEANLSQLINLPPNVRLACQTTVSGGPVKLRRILQDESDFGLYIRDDDVPAASDLGMERELVLFFLDIRRFTEFVETQLAFDVIHIIRKLFTLFQSIVESNGGEIVETVGDGFYATFGGEEPPPQAASNALQAALSILADLERLNETYFRVHFDRYIEVGIGIHYGSVITGNVQLSQGGHKVVMGYPVNIAARLQNATKDLNNSLVVSARFYGLLDYPGMPAQRHSILLKGVSGPFDAVTLGSPYRSE